jgi:phospholipid/cholesterol/gamma-HCH transport system substrate-binding protein
VNASAPAGDPVIEVRQVSTRFGAHVVHRDITLAVRRAEVFALIGGSGSGKSTLLREMILLHRPDSGSIRVLGADLQNLDRGGAEALRQRWGVLFQHGGLFGSLTVLENVGLPLREHTDLDDALIDEIAAWKIAMTGLAPEVGAQYPSELSGGMLKRASLARALALDPELLFLDEPTAGLDPISAGGFDHLVLKLRDLFGLTIVMVTHDLDLLWQVADRVADRSPGDPPLLRRRAWPGRAATRPTHRPPSQPGAPIETKVNYTLVGAFVLLLGTALIAGALWLASGGAFQKKYDLYLAIEDESVAGLNLNAPVKFNGVEVGKVRGIQLDPANPERVRLLFAIERGTPIREDTLAVLKTQGLTGIAYVELTGSTGDAPPLRASGAERYPVIRTKPSLSTRLENVLTTVLAKLDSTSSNIDAILSDENREAFTRTLANLSAVSQALAERTGALDAGIASATRTFDNTARATAQLQPVIERIGRSAEAIEKLGDSAALASTRAGHTVDAVGADVQRFTAQTLPELQRLLGELNVLSTSLRRVSEQVERNPSGLLFGRAPVPPGPGETATGGSRPTAEPSTPSKGSP